MIDRTRVMQLLEDALALDGDERVRFLDRECADDIALRREVTALLDADDGATAADFLAMPLQSVVDRTGETLGAYRLVRAIGSGGMGSVYLAARTDGAYDKPVAIKCLLFDAGDIRARFLLERRILGRLTHPNIATLLDVGSDRYGAPYLVMEYVDGLPITTFAGQRELDVRARIVLFLKILDALQTAHGLLIVHRDIKPSNVLVDRFGEPKLLDFGIAKLLGDTESTTRTRLAPLTPEYASPEQLRGEPIGTASDIYGLGVLLYELVADRRPYRIDTARPSEIERVVSESEPPRPSTFVDVRQLRGSASDLDAIILKALEKTPERRYVSCAAFAKDLRSWLDGELIDARMPATRERAVRFVRRHALGTAVAATAIVTLAIGATVALWQARAAIVERDHAARINAFLQDILGAVDHTSLGRDAKLGDVLDGARRKAERMLDADPQMLAETELTLAKAYGTLGDLDNALASVRLAESVADKSGNRSLALDARIALANVLVNRGDLNGAEDVIKHARADALTFGSARQRGDSAAQFGFLETKRQNYAAAKHWLRTALDELPSDLVELRASTLNDLGVTEDAADDYAASARSLREAVALLRRLYPNGHPLLSQAIGNLATTLDDAGDREAASALYAESLKMKINLLGEDHFSVVGTLATLTWRGVQQNDVTSALSYGERAWAGAQKLPQDNPAVSYAAITYAQALMRAGRAREALPLIETALTKRRASLPAESPLLINTESVLALAEAEAGETAVGKALAQSTYRRLLATLGEGHQLTQVAKQRLDEVESIASHSAAADIARQSPMH